MLIFGQFWVIFRSFWQFWVIFGPFWVIFGLFWVIFGPFFGAIFLATNWSLQFLLLFASLLLFNVTKSKVWARARCDCERSGTSWLPGRTSWPGSPRHSSWHSSSRDRWQLHMWSSFYFKSYFAAGDLLDPHLVLLPDPLLHEHREQHGEDLVHRREPAKQGFQEKSRLNLYFCTKGRLPLPK